MSLVYISGKGQEKREDGSHDLRREKKRGRRGATLFTSAVKRGEGRKESKGGGGKRRCLHSIPGRWEERRLLPSAIKKKEEEREGGGCKGRGQYRKKEFNFSRESG